VNRWAAVSETPPACLGEVAVELAQSRFDQQCDDLVDRIDLPLVERAISEIEGVILFEKNNEFECIERLQAAAQQQGIRIGERLSVPFFAEQIC